MKQKKPKDKIGATPGKLALIGVLALVLVTVVVQQLPESAPETVSLSAVSPGNASPGNQTSRTPTKNTKRQRPARIEKTSNPKSGRELQKAQSALLQNWPSVDFAKTLANDPFKRPRWAVPKVTNTVASKSGSNTLEKLQSQGATIVVIADGKKSATIGEQKYYIGDELAGYRITDITTQGVLLNKL